MLTSPAVLSLILIFILLGSGVMGLAILKTNKILRLLQHSLQLKRWRILFALMVFFLAGYSLAFFLVYRQYFDFIPLLMGTVFFFGALFVLFSVSTYYQTLKQLLVTQSESESARQNAELALRQLQQTKMQLIHNEQMLSLGKMVGGIAHEINNPISFIHGNLNHLNAYSEAFIQLFDLYDQAYPDPPIEIVQAIENIDLDFVKTDLPKLIQSMGSGTCRVQKIVQSLRTFSRLDEAGYKYDSLHQGIDSTLILLQGQLHPYAHLPAIEVIKQYGHLPAVECHLGALNQVFLNLITNAIDALRLALSQIPDLQPKIIIKTQQIDRDRVQVSIADNGCGIVETARDRIFDPFFTTKPVGKGTGLGLSVSYEIIVDQHQGQLDFISSPNEGTEFILQLPISHQTNR
mgnify:CR=1 FL=1